MSHTTVCIHRVVSAKAEVKQREGHSWLALEFTDANGDKFAMSIFHKDGTPQGLLASLTEGETA